jgi:hypothetical protein
LSRCNVYTSFQKQEARIYFGASHNYPYLFKSYSAQFILCHHSDLEKYLLKYPEFNVFVKSVIGLQPVLYTQYGNNRGINGSMLEYRLVDYQFTESVTNLLLSLDKDPVSPSIYERVYNTFFSPVPDPDAAVLKQERLTLLVLLFENGLLTQDTLETVQHELGRLTPIGFLNIEGYFNGLFSFVSHGENSGFISSAQTVLPKINSTPHGLLTELFDELDLTAPKAVV